MQPSEKVSASAIAEKLSALDTETLLLEYEDVLERAQIATALNGFAKLFTILTICVEPYIGTLRTKNCT